MLPLEHDTKKDLEEITNEELSPNQSQVSKQDRSHSIKKSVARAIGYAALISSLALGYGCSRSGGGGSSPTGSTGASGKISEEQAQYILKHNQTQGYECVNTWDLPIRVFVEPTVSKTNVEEAMNYWRQAGISYTMVGSHQIPGVLWRKHTNADTAARGFTVLVNPGPPGCKPVIEAVVSIHSDYAFCDINNEGCKGVFRHEAGRVAGFWYNYTADDVMSPQAFPSNASPASLRMILGLYVPPLPHNARVQPNGDWSIKQ